MSRGPDQASICDELEKRMCRLLRRGAPLRTLCHESSVKPVSVLEANHELSALPVMVTKTASEFTHCPVPVKETIPECPVCPVTAMVAVGEHFVMAKKANSEHCDCPVLAKEAFPELSVCPATANKADPDFSDYPVISKEAELFACPIMVRKTVSSFGSSTL
ncbi:hypothetical protein M9458_035613, partial [Cirrhinus mrigala]